MEKRQSLVWKTTVETGRINLNIFNLNIFNMVRSALSNKPTMNEREEEENIRNILLLIIFVCRCISEVNKNKVINGCLLDSIVKK